MSVFSFLRGRASSDVTREESEIAQDAIYQHGRREFNNRIKEVTRHLRLAWTCVGAMSVITTASIGGMVYLGTLPKSIVEWKTLDPAGFSLPLYTREYLVGRDKDRAVRERIMFWLKGLRQVYYFDPKKQELALTEAAVMTAPDTPAWNKAVGYYNESKPYERQKKESVTVSAMLPNKVGEGTYHIDFVEVTTDMASKAETCQKYIAIITAQERKDAESKRNAPMGIMVVDFSIEEAGKCRP